jgi:Sperm-tail PG-rich repeat
MRARSPNANGDNFPGPGLYYNDKSLIGGPESLKYTIGEKREGRFDNGIPGPGDYLADDHLTHQRATAAFIASSQKGSPLPRDVISQPGPGTYYGEPAQDKRFKNLSYQFPQGVRMSPMGKDQLLNPGPAAYQTALDGNFGKDGVKVKMLT